MAAATNTAHTPTTSTMGKVSRFMLTSLVASGPLGMEALPPILSRTLPEVN
jgi:hypothetical protein